MKYYKVVEIEIEPVIGTFITQCVLDCSLCGAIIKSTGGGAEGFICKDCYQDLLSGKLQKPRTNKEDVEKSSGHAQQLRNLAPGEYIDRFGFVNFKPTDRFNDIDKDQC